MDVNPSDYRAVHPQVTTEYRLSVNSMGTPNAPAGPEHKEVTVTLSPAVPTGQWFPFCFKLESPSGDCFTVVAYAPDLAAATKLAQDQDTSSTVTPLPNCDFLDAVCSLGTSSSAISIRKRLAALASTAFLRNERITKLISQKDAAELASILRRKILEYVPEPRKRNRKHSNTSLVSLRGARSKTQKRVHKP
jgi:hypothetical protein